MDVDIYGKCGKFKCPRTNEDKCYKDMAKNYKFYLSFENSVCEDYITEKFFRILKYNVIPVTYNGVDMEKFAPYHSYINTLDFKGVSVLAQYLQKVSFNNKKKILFQDVERTNYFQSYLIACFVSVRYKVITKPHLAR